MNLPLRDIKPNEVLMDYDFFIFLGIVAIVCLLIILVIYIFYKKKIYPKKLKIKKLKNINLEDSKFVAYNFKKMAKEFINEKNKDLFEKIEKNLQKYKYKPNVPPLSNELKKDINKFLKGL